MYTGLPRDMYSAKQQTRAVYLRHAHGRYFFLHLLCFCRREGRPFAFGLVLPFFSCSRLFCVGLLALISGCVFP